MEGRKGWRGREVGCRWRGWEEGRGGGRGGSQRRYGWMNTSSNAFIVDPPEGDHQYGGYLALSQSIYGYNTSLAP